MASNGCREWLTIEPTKSGYYQGKGGWEEEFEYGGIRYHAVLWPSGDGKGIQDPLLSLLSRACEEDDDMIDEYGDDCRGLIWPLIKQDHASRPQREKNDLSPSKEVVPIEGRTVNGQLRAFAHTRKFGPRIKPISNTFYGIPTFCDKLVRRITRLDDEIFEVEYEGKRYCLKTVNSKEGGPGLKREITILQRCHHPHIIPIRGIVVNGRNSVEGMLTELIPDPITLENVDFSHFSKEQCYLWLSQIRSAVKYLHDNGLVWGDAKPANILIRPNNDLVLVDFAGGATDEWVDWKNINTRDGDMQALDRIEQFLHRKVVDCKSNN